MYLLIICTSHFYLKLKERWEDLKKNISINPQGNRVRFIPIVPNNAKRPNVLSPTPLRSLIFKPFTQKNITNYTSKENTNSVQQKIERGKKNMPVTNMENSHYPTRFFTNNYKSISLQQNQQEIKQLNSKTSFVGKCNMNALDNSLPKLPLRTIWSNDNTSKDFGCSLSLKNNASRKPVSTGLNCLSQTTQNSNYALKSTFSNKTSQVLPNLSTTFNNSRYLKSSSVSSSSSQILYSTTENMNTSFFTADNEKSSLATDQNINVLEPNTLSCSKQPFNIEDIWGNHHY